MATFDDEPPSLEQAGDVILGPQGPIAAAFPRYQPRQPQIQMANLCGRIMQRGGAALIEAGTGTGKSFGYLIPAILSGERVVVSTDTIQLQEQLVSKDLPFLADVLQDHRERPLTYAIAKGRSHYLCPRNCAALIEEAGLFDDYNLPAKDAAAALAELGSGWDGDRAHLVNLQLPEDRWLRLAGEESCTGRSCEYANECPYLRAKAAFEEADVVITNHTMCLLHHKVLDATNGAVGILPAHRTLIVDEAHTLGDKAGEVFGIEVGHRRPAGYVKRVRRQVKRLKLAIPDEDLDLESVQRAADAFFEVWHGAVKTEQLLPEFPPEILDFARDLAKTLAEELKPLRLALYWAAMRVPAQDAERRQAIERLYAGADQLLEDIERLLSPEPDPHHVKYAEVLGSDLAGKEVKLHCQPIETKPIFRRILERLDSAIFTSATLASGPGISGFEAAAEELGLNLGQTETLQVESPFDYARVAAGYVPKGMPEFRSPDYHQALAAEIEALLHHTEGRAFVLFTSFRDLHAVYDLLARHLPYPLFKQKTDSKDKLIEQFRTTPRAVLFGTMQTFGTGVDIPGDALVNVILTKIPFPQPEAPLNKARCQRIEQRGGNSFREFMLPRAIQRVKQTFGRLIRSTEDVGLFALLDPRIRSSRYGRQILAALPPFPGSGNLAELPRFLPEEERAA